MSFISFVKAALVAIASKGEGNGQVRSSDFNRMEKLQHALRGVDDDGLGGGIGS